MGVNDPAAANARVSRPWAAARWWLTSTNVCGTWKKSTKMFALSTPARPGLWLNLDAGWGYASGWFFELAFREPDGRCRRGWRYRQGRFETYRLQRHD